MQVQVAWLQACLLLPLLPLLLLLTLRIPSSTAVPTLQQRLTLADWGSYSYTNHKGPGTYAFGYDIEDAGTNNVQFRQEERHANGTVTGSYGHVQPDGHVRITHYVADNLGYRVKEEDVPASGDLPHPGPTPLEEHAPVFEAEFFPSTIDEEAITNGLDDSEQPVLQLLPPIPETKTPSRNYPASSYYTQPNILTSLYPKPVKTDVRVGFLQSIRVPSQPQPQFLIYERRNGY